MSRLSLMSAALALCCIAAAPTSALAQGDGSAIQYEREHPTPPCQARRGAGPDQSLVVGATLPKAYRGNQAVVNDWAAHQLAKPSWGAQWIQVGADYVLVEPLTHRIRAIKLYGC